MFPNRLKLISVLALAVTLMAACMPVVTPPPAAPAQPTEAPAAAQPTTEAAPTPEAAQPAATEAGVVTLDWAVEWPDDSTIAPFTEMVIKPFEAAHPNIKINIVRHAGADALDRDMKAELAAGGGPDIFDTNGPSWVPPYADAGKVLNLDPYAKEMNWQQKMVPFGWDASLINGSIYSLPAAFEGLFLWYNKDLFEKNGWQVPKTYDELVTLSKDIQSKGLIPFAFGTADCKACWEWWISYSLGAYLGPTKFYQVLTGEVPWTDPDVIKAFNMLKDLYSQGFIMDKQQSASAFNDAWGVWGDQKAVMRMEGTWGFDFADEYAKNFQYAIAPLPGWRDGVATVTPIGIGESVVINAATKHPEEAATMLDWMISNPDYLGTWAGKLTSTFVPPVALTREQFAPDTNPIVVDAFSTMMDVMNKGEASYVAWTAFPAKTDAYAWNNMEDMLMGTISVEEYVNGIQKQFDEEKAAGKLPTVPKPAPTAP
jgi:raffinose/stachyose/melibiose transport system substrate-binding protein